MTIACGIIPIFITASGTKEYLVLQSRGGYWGFPKGHPEPDETHEVTAIREAYEETGIRVSPDDLGNPVQYEYRQPIRGTLQTKRVILFPVQITSKDVTLQSSEIARHAWVPYPQALSLIGLEAVTSPLAQVERDYTIESPA